MELNSKISRKIKELQVLEQNSQSSLMQKQSFQMELNESLNALEELKKSGDEVYKISSGIMLKSDKKSIIAELEEKKKIFGLKIESLEKQERENDEKIEKLRAEISESFEKEQK